MDDLLIFDLFFLGLSKISNLKETMKTEFTDEEILLLFKDLIQADRSRTIRKQLISIIQSRDSRKHFSIVLDSKILLHESVALGHLILRHPDRILNLFSHALEDEQLRLSQEVQGYHNVKDHIHARITWLPSVHRKDNIS